MWFFSIKYPLRASRVPVPGGKEGWEWSGSPGTAEGALGGCSAPQNQPRAPGPQTLPAPKMAAAAPLRGTLARFAGGPGRSPCKWRRGGRAGRPGWAEVKWGEVKRGRGGGRHRHGAHHHPQGKGSPRPAASPPSRRGPRGAGGFPGRDAEEKPLRGGGAGLAPCLSNAFFFFLVIILRSWWIPINQIPSLSLKAEVSLGVPCASQTGRGWAWEA